MPPYPQPYCVAQFALVIEDEWFLNPAAPIFNGSMPVVYMPGNSTQSFKLPPLGDANGDKTWSTCDLTSISSFASYNNITEILKFYPGPADIGIFMIKCTVHDINPMPRNTSTTFFANIFLPPPVKIVKPPPPPIPRMENRKIKLPWISKVTVLG